MVSKPTGTVTFLFTDVEGSTALWRDHPASMTDALRRHDAIVRGAMESHAGYVFSTAGDGFSGAFGRAADATAAARGAQIELNREQWPSEAVIRVRMGVHTGEVEERDGDYFGMPVNVAARLMSSSVGGQVLLSGVTADLLGGQTDLVDLGERVLRDVAGPVRVFALGGPGLVIDPPVPAAVPDRLAFGEFVVDAATREIRRAGSVVPVEPQVFDVLRHLIEHRHRLVTKEELLEEVWGDQFVGESALTSRIRSARRAVGDDGRRQAVIRTIHGHGYQFIAPVAIGDATTAGAGVSHPQADPSWRTLAVAPEVLIEREAALEKLTTARERADAGEGQVVVVRGDAGMGKTALLQSFLDGLDPDTSRVAVARCFNLLAPRPLGPIIDLSSQLGTRDAASDAIASATEGTELVVDGISRSSTVVVVVIEDVHWSDDATLDSIMVLARLIQPHRALLVLTGRDTEIRPDHPILGVIADLRAAGGTVVDLEPISPAGLDRWARHLGIHVPDLHRRTGGNALLATELLAAPSEAVPAGVRDAVLARLARLSPEARRAVEALSMSPRPVDLDLAAAVLGDDLEALSEAERSGLIHLLDGAVVFRHELVRAATHESVPLFSRLRIHRRFHDHLVDGDDRGRLLHHAAEAQIPEVVLDLGPVAARHAASLEAHRQSCEHYERVLRYASELDGTDEAPLRSEYAYQLYLTWDLERAELEAALALERWQELGDTVGEGSVLTTLGRIRLFTGHPSALPNIERAVELLEPHGETTELARAYCELAGALVIGDHNEAAAAPAQRALELARDVGDVALEALALNYQALVARATGESAEEGLRRSLELAVDARPREYATRVLSNLIVDLWEMGRWEEASEVAHRAEVEVGRFEYTASVVTLRVQTVHVALVMGELEEALAKLDWVDAVDRTGANRLEARILRHRATMRLGDGDWAEKLGALWTSYRSEPAGSGKMEESLGARSRYPILLLMVVMAELAWRTGNEDLARDVAGAFSADPLGAQWPIDQSELAFYLHLSGVDSPIPREQVVEPFATAFRGGPGIADAFEQAGRPFDASVLRERGA